MGSDNLSRWRKSKNTKKLQRRQASRAAYKKILIVCEGEKTEPDYFREARTHYRLGTVDVQVSGDCGPDPKSIVKFAKQRFREEKNAGDPFDKVYCVFDKDGHATYEYALDALNSTARKDTYFAINSVPCFEYWLLLHFDYSTRPYTNLSGNSPCHQVSKALKKYIPDYQKGQRRIFDCFIDRLDQAMKNAEQALRDSEHNQTDNPSTRVHQLIRVLQDLKKT